MGFTVKHLTCHILFFRVHRVTVMTALHAHCSKSAEGTLSHTVCCVQVHSLS